MNNLLAVNAGATVDAVIIALMFIFALIGLIRGFSSTVIKFLGGILSLILAFVLCKNTASLLNRLFGLTDKLSARLVVSLKNVFDENLLNMTLADFKAANGNVAGFTVPKFIISLLLKLAGDGLPADTTVGQALAPAFAYYIAIAIGFVVCYLLLRILFFILARLLKKLTKIKVIGAADKVLGLIVGAVQGFLVCYVALSVLGLLPFKNLTAWLDASAVARFISGINVFGLIFGTVNPSEYIKGIVGG